jgi:hypothetical protein
LHSIRSRRQNTFRLIVGRVESAKHIGGLSNTACPLSRRKVEEAPASSSIDS